MNNQHSAPAPQQQQQQAASLYPNKPGFRPEQPVAVGGEILLSDPIEYNTGRRTVKVTVRNTGDRPIQVGSHFHFFEVNRYLDFDRDITFGCHLNIPATTAIRFEPGDQKEVEVVAYAGKRRVIGFNGLVMGYTGEEDAPTYFPARLRALRKVRNRGFKVSGQGDAATGQNARNGQDGQQAQNGQNDKQAQNGQNDKQAQNGQNAQNGQAAPQTNQNHKN